MSTILYINAISNGFPNTQVSYQGNVADNIYENLIHEQGDPIPSKEVLDAWIDAKVKTEMWERIKEERDKRKTYGGYTVGSYWFHSDDTSRIQQLALVMLGANMPGNIMWKTMSNDFVLMTPTLASQIFQAAMMSDMTLFTIAEQKKAVMLASQTPGDYNYLSGWPPAYGE